MKNILFVLLFLSVTVTVWADKVYLKSGGVIEGEVMTRDSYSVVIKLNGVPQRYVLEDVDHVEMAGEPKEEGPFKVDPSQFTGISKKKLDLIAQLLQINGTRSTMGRNFEKILAQLPPAQKDSIKDLLKTDEILLRIIPLYDKHFSEPEILQLIQFYSSPIGKKILDTMPVLINETVQVSAQYFQEKLKPEGQ